MGRYRRVSLLLGLLMLPALLFAQFNNNTSSPYSRYGIGDVKGYVFGRANAMGGASIGSRYNQQINLSNPAAYSAVDSLGFMFEFGVDGKSSEFTNNVGSSTTNNSNFEYFAMNFQVSNRAGATLGMVPFSNVGYNVQQAQDLENVGAVSTLYYGAGTISKAFFGFAYEPLKNLSLGVNLNYYFGKLNRNTEITFAQPNFYSVQQYKDLRLSDFSLDFGAQVTIPMKNKQKIILGAVYENKPTYNAFFTDIIQKNLSSGGAVDQDTLYYTLEENGKIEFASTYGFGLSYVKQDKWEINADYYHQSWGDATFFGSKSDFLTDLDKFAVGAEWIPERFSIQSYLKKIAYRVGMKYEQTYLEFGGQQINDFGISFGVGLPVVRSKSSINIAAEFGKRGTTDYNLVQENYVRLNLSVNLYDLWFVKRRFD